MSFRFIEGYCEYRPKTSKKYRSITYNANYNYGIKFDILNIFSKISRGQLFR